MRAGHALSKVYIFKIYVTHACNTHHVSNKLRPVNGRITKLTSQKADVSYAQHLAFKYFPRPRKTFEELERKKGKGGGT